MGFELKNDLKPSASDRRSNKLEAIGVRLVPSHLEVREETFDCLFECHPMNCQLVRFEIVLEISRREPVPIDHTRDCTVRARAEQYSLPCWTNKGVIAWLHTFLPTEGRRRGVSRGGWGAVSHAASQGRPMARCKVAQ